MSHRFNFLPGTLLPIQMNHITAGGRTTVATTHDIRNPQDAQST